MSFPAGVRDKAVLTVDGAGKRYVFEVSGGERINARQVGVNKNCWEKKEVRKRGGKGHVLEATDKVDAE